MNVYIEGPDAIGKSTLSDALHQRYGFLQEHITAAEPNDLEYYKNLIMNTDHTIYDRFCLGELLYSALYGRDPRLTAKELIQCISNISKKDDIFIVLNTSNVQLIRDRYIKRGEFDFLPDATAQVAQFAMMWYVMEVFENPRFIYWDVSKGYDELYEKIFALIEKEAQ